MPHASPEYKCRPRLVYADWDYQQDPDPRELCVDDSRRVGGWIACFVSTTIAQSCGALLVLDSISEGRSTTRGSIFFLSVPLLK